MIDEDLDIERDEHRDSKGEVQRLTVLAQVVEEFCDVTVRQHVLCEYTRVKRIDCQHGDVEEKHLRGHRLILQCYSPFAEPARRARRFSFVCA